MRMMKVEIPLGGNVRAKVCITQFVIQTPVMMCWYQWHVCELSSVARKVVRALVVRTGQHLPTLTHGRLASTSSSLNLKSSSTILLQVSLIVDFQILNSLAQAITQQPSQVHKARINVSADGKPGNFDSYFVAYPMYPPTLHGIQAVSSLTTLPNLHLSQNVLPLTTT